MGRTVVFGDFEWDEEKADRNVRDHGVSFPEAVPAILDPFALELPDPTPDEAGRVDVVGTDALGRVLYVVTIDRDGDRIRIVSARRAEAREARDYRNGFRRFVPQE